MLIRQKNSYVNVSQPKNLWCHSYRDFLLCEKILCYVRADEDWISVHSSENISIKLSSFISLKDFFLLLLNVTQRTNLIVPQFHLIWLPYSSLTLHKWLCRIKQLSTKNIWKEKQIGIEMFAEDILLIGIKLTAEIKILHGSR